MYYDPRSDKPLTLDDEIDGVSLFYLIRDDPYAIARLIDSEAITVTDSAVFWLEMRKRMEPNPNRDTP